MPLKVVADIGFGAGPIEIERFNQKRRIIDRRRSGAGRRERRASARKVIELPAMKNLPVGVAYAAAGQAKWQAEMIHNFIIAVLAGVFLVFAVLVLLYRRFCRRFVNMGSLLLAPLGGLLALLIDRAARCRCRCSSGC